MLQSRVSAHVSSLSTDPKRSLIRGSVALVVLALFIQGVPNLAAGVYFLRLVVADKTLTRTVFLVP